MRGTALLGIPVAACLLALAGCGSKPAPTGALAQREMVLPVRAAAVTQRSEPVQLRAIGNIQPYSTVQVKAEVGGELTGVHFTEGQDVRKGDLLFTIDPRPFEAALQQATANRQRDEAQAQNAAADAKRDSGLAASGIVARQQAEQTEATAAAMRASVAADEAAIETARIQLNYTKIYSPIDGRTGNLLVYRGNIVKANDVPMVVINQVQPIYAAFAVPSQNLPDIKRYMAAHRLRVEASPKGSGQPGSVGELTFIDNNIDTTTGTIQLKGTFPNRDRALWPGEFVDVTLTLTTQPNAIVAPSAAIQNGQQGQYVFVITPDMHVEMRPVVVDRTQNQDAIIRQGLRLGEQVVTDGQLRLAPGARVRIVTRSAS